MEAETFGQGDWGNELIWIKAMQGDYANSIVVEYKSFKQLTLLYEWLCTSLISRVTQMKPCLRAFNLKNMLAFSPH